METSSSRRRLIVRLPYKQTSTTPESLSGRHPFERRIDEMKVSKMDINFVIMDYLINEGYPAAAKKFAAEANIQPLADAAEYIEERLEIRKAILAGNIQPAIEKINDLNPELLDLDASLHFALLRLQLIELIRPCTESASADITPALEFAQSSLAPRAPTNPDFLSDLERTMALLIFSNDSDPPPMLKGLLDKELRQTVATRVNEAILGAQGLHSQARLKSLVKLRSWAEKRAREQGTELPGSMDVWASPSGQLATAEDTVMSHDGDEIEPMVP